MNALKIAAIGGEIAILGATATVAWGLVAGSGALLIAGPIVVAATALELTRLPLVMRAGSGKLGFFGATSAILLASCITLVTAETLVLGVDGLLSARSAGTANAEIHLAEVQTAFDAAKAAAARRDAERDRLTVAVAEAQKHAEAVGREAVSLQTNPAVSAYRTRRGGWAAPGSGAANAVAAANARAQADHTHQVEAAEADLTVARAALAAAAPVDIKAEEADLVAARQVVGRARAANPLSRLAASLYRTDVENLRPEDYATVCRTITISLAPLMAAGTLMAGLISALPDRNSRPPSKLARAIRATLAARRKRLRRLEATTVTQIRERVVYRYVPCDPESGKAIG